MGSLTISDKILEKYFSYLKNLDVKTKKRLISKLSKSIKSDSKKEFDLNKMFGAWSNTKSSDEIISEIKNARVNKMISESFE